MMDVRLVPVDALVLSRSDRRFTRGFPGAGPSADGLIALIGCDSLILYARLNPPPLHFGGHAMRMTKVRPVVYRWVIYWSC